MKFQVANLLTILRLALVPVFLIFFIVKWYVPAFFTFGIATFTDLIDGTVARVLKERSQLGGFLDPLADKILMVTTFSCLTAMRILPPWFLVLVILRDVVIMSGIWVLKVLKIEVEYESIRAGKLATLSETVLGLLSLSYMGWPGTQFGPYPLGDFIYGMMLVTAILIVISGLMYVGKGLGILQKSKRKKPVTSDQ